MNAIFPEERRGGIVRQMNAIIPGKLRGDIVIAELVNMVFLTLFPQ